MIVVTRCRRCGQEYEADRVALIDGPGVWQFCPACRGLRDESGGGRMPWEPPPDDEEDER